MPATAASAPVDWVPLSGECREARGPVDYRAAGAEPKFAGAIAEGIARAAPHQSGTSSIGILATVTALGFILITVVFGRLMFEASQQRSDLRVAIEANRDLIEAGNERLTRIKTLLDERLPPR